MNLVREHTHHSSNFTRTSSAVPFAVLVLPPPSAVSKGCAAVPARRTARLQSPGFPSPRVWPKDLVEIPSGNKRAEERSACASLDLNGSARLREPSPRGVQQRCRAEPSAGGGRRHGARTGPSLVPRGRGAPL